jgi:hypothetical protein
LVIYQLPNGKIVYLTVEELLDLSDEDIAYLLSIDYGESANSPWLGSVLPNKNRSSDFSSNTDDDDVSGPELPPDDFDMGLDIPDVDFD